MVRTCKRLRATAWVAAVFGFAATAAAAGVGSGGAATRLENGDCVHAFTQHGVFVAPTDGDLTVRYLVVGGGGAGGGCYGGGGGGGGVREGTLVVPHGTRCAIEVGEGGRPGVFTTGGNGGASVFTVGATAVVAPGGGGGGGSVAQCAGVGATGGGDGGASSDLMSQSQLVGTDGRKGGSRLTYKGGGGAGAGTDGGNATSTASGAGGDGVASDITGISVYYGGGGAGAYNGGQVVGGQGGGGASRLNGSGEETLATDGADGFGGGGGGGAYKTRTIAGRGGRGVVILRYATTSTDEPVSDPADTRAELRFSTIFSDGMVLQRDRAVSVYGKAEPGETVTVEFAGKSVSAVADTDGFWKVQLPALAASATGRDLVARGEGDGRYVRLADVLVGDVWLLGGQSNMESVRLGGTMKSLEEAQHRSDAANAMIRAAKLNGGSGIDPSFTAETTNGGNPWCTLSACWGQLSAIGYYFARRVLDDIPDVPVGLVCVALQGTAIASHMPPNGGIYTARVKPMSDFVFRGILWYQGESDFNKNATDGRTISTRYRANMKTLVDGWRTTFGRTAADMPFYYVQIAMPNFAVTGEDVAGYNGYASIREAQTLFLQDSDSVGMAVSYDVSELGEIHPLSKNIVGRRLGLVALANDYGKSYEWTGPTFKSASVEGSAIRVKFDHVGDGLTLGKCEAVDGDEPVVADTNLLGFAVASLAKDGDSVITNWHWATSSRIDGNDVLVSSPDVTHPALVQYANFNEPRNRANLYNTSAARAAKGSSALLPAVSFGIREAGGWRYESGDTPDAPTGNAYTITFADGWGTTLSVQQVEAGQSAVCPPDPTHAGYVFTGWDTVEWEYAAADTLVTAQWRADEGGGDESAAGHEDDVPGGIVLSPLYQDHMVLQRGQQIRVWGRNTAGRAMTVTFGGQTATATTDADGYWTATFANPFAASATGRTITVSDNVGCHLTVLDVVVGDVYLATGQSNMDLRMTGDNVFTNGTEKGDALFRYRRMPRGTSRANPLVFDTLEPTDANRARDWTPTTDEVARNAMSACAYYFGMKLRQEAPGVPVGVVVASKGATVIVEHMTPETVAALNAAGNSFGASASQCWNAMLNPLRKGSFRGAIWYQGESDAAVGTDDYRMRLQSLVGGWRDVWGADFAFYCVQLHVVTPYKGADGTVAAPDAAGNVCQREAQRLWFEADTGKKGLAVICATAEVNTHARDKQFVGERLALWALKDFNGATANACGPLFQSATSAGNGRVRVAFKAGTARGLSAGARTGESMKNPNRPVVLDPTAAIRGFALSANGSDWAFADTVTVDGETLLVSATAVSSPAYIHYGAWNNPYACGVNLYNEDKLECSPFAPVAVGAGSGDPEPPAGHTHVWSAWTTNPPPDCVTAGSRSRTCSAAGCVIVTQTETIKALGHAWGDWVVTKPAEIGVKGEETRTCARCTATQTREIAPLPHPEDRHPMTDATQGYYMDVEVGGVTNRVEVFTNVTKTVAWTVPANVTSLDYLVVGGGGGGGWTYGGGGGGGGVLVGTLANPSGTYAITVGAGGAGSTKSSGQPSADGADSAFGDLTAGGGGGGGSYSFDKTGHAGRTGTAGGSGGGGTNAQSSGSGGSGNPAGNAGSPNGTKTVGGGGGAGSAGGVCTGLINTLNVTGDEHAGNGGDGITSEITGSSVCYGGGGGGGGAGNSDKTTFAYYMAGGKGGNGGGGDGGTRTGTAGVEKATPVAAVPGVDGLGGGGGGGAANGLDATGAKGGDGVVILRYVLPTGGESPEPPAGHTHVWGDWYTNVVPQVGMAGELRRDCCRPDCGGYETQVLPALPDPEPGPGPEPEPGEREATDYGYRMKVAVGGVTNMVCVFTNVTQTWGWQVPSNVTSLDYLVVGGGGGGGAQYGGGGGGGGVLSGTASVTAGDTLTVAVGLGGAGGAYAAKVANPGTNGGASALANGMTEIACALGGGGGAKLRSAGFAGANGGGGSKGAGGAATMTGGFAGGGSTGVDVGSGGGGAGGVGGLNNKKTDQTGLGGAGGAGVESTITGNAVRYAGGGGGGGAENGSGTTYYAAGGLGTDGGGNGGTRLVVDGNYVTGVAATPGVDGLGGGGGGGAHGSNGANMAGAKGGDGTVILRYALPKGEPPAKPTVDGQTVEPDRVFETARVGKPIAYPAAPTLSGEIGAQAIAYGGSTTAVPVYYTAALSGNVVSLALNDRAKPTFGDKDATKAIEVTGDGAIRLNLTNVHAALCYTLQTCASLGGGWSSVATQQGRADFETQQQGSARFFRIVVSDAQK